MEDNNLINLVSDDAARLVETITTSPTADLISG